jgi:hypothetical protein
LKSFRLSREQRERLLEGNYSALKFKTKPFGCEPGSVYVLNWQRELRSTDDQGNVIVVDRQPLRWITVRSVQRRPLMSEGSGANWVVKFDVTDRRHPVRLVRRKPPATPTTGDDKKNSREESAYTSDRKAAVDHLEAIDEDTLKKYADPAFERDDELRRERARKRLPGQWRARRGRAA